MSLYAVNKLCRRVVHEAALRERLRNSPEQALRDADPPLTEEERDLLLAGDVGRLGRLGASHFLLMALGRYELFGLSLPEHGLRMRVEYARERADWGLAPTSGDAR